MDYIYTLVFETQDPSGQTINKELMSFDNVESAFKRAELEMRNKRAQSIKIVRSPRGFL